MVLKSWLVPVIVATAVGLILGAICGFFKTNVILTLGPWGIAGLVIGYLVHRVRPALGAGAAFGFMASLIYLVLLYNGSKPVYMVLPFFVLLSLFGAVCGAILGLIGAFARQRLQPSPTV